MEPVNGPTWVTDLSINPTPWNPGNEQFFVTFELSEEGEKLLSEAESRKDPPSEGCLPGGIISKSNEKGAVGLGRDFLSKLNPHLKLVASGRL